MKKISYFLVAVIAMFAITNVFAAEVGTAADLNTCASAGGTCTLSADVELTSALEIGKEVVLDLNGYSITPADTFTGDSLIIVLHGGTLTVKDSKGNGKISADTESVYVGVKMTKAGGDETKQAMLVVESGTIEGYSYGISGNGNPGRGNTAIEIYGGTVKALNTTGTGIYHPQKGYILVEDGTIVGGTGIEMRSGNLEVTGGTIHGTYIPSSSSANGNGTTTLGAGIAVAQHTTQQPIVVTIHGGTIKGYTAFKESNPQSNDQAALDKVSILIEWGSFEVTDENGKAVESENYEGFITGGEFGSEIDEEYLAQDLVAKEQEDGSYLVGVEHTITVAAVKNGKVTVDKVKAVAGEKVAITSTPDKGYKVEKVEVALANATAGSAVEGNAAGFIMPDGDVVVTVTFAKVAENVPNPNTSDSLMIYVALAIISVAGLSVVAMNKKRFN